MDDDEEIRSHASQESEDYEKPYHSPPNSPPISGGVSVTVAAAAPPPASSSSTAAGSSSPLPATPPPVPLTLALPIQQSSAPARSTVVTGSGGGGGGGGREDCWSDSATSVLIDAWGERYTELSRGNLKQKHWQEVADIVFSHDDSKKPPKTDIQCKNRIDTVKKKYKIEKAKVAAGCGPSRWPFYERLDRLIGATVSAGGSSGKGSFSDSPAAAQKAIPVGIPVGVRQPMPLGVSPYGSTPLQRPPHLQSPPLQMRHGFSTPFPQQPQQRFNQGVGVNHHNSGNYGGVGRIGNLNNSGRHQVMHQQQQLPQQQQEEPLFMGKGLVGMRLPPPDSDSEGEQWSQDSGDSLPPETGSDRRKRARVEMNASGRSGGKKRKVKRKEVRVWGNSVRELTRAILKFGEAYEAAESAKLEHVVEMEKQRMKFAKELELQRMKFLMKTQLELSQLNETANGNENGSGSGSGSGNSDSRGGGSSERRDGGDGNGGGEESNHLNHLSDHQENHVNLANSDSSN